LTNPAIASLIGATKAYRGFTFTFDGKRWNKGQEAFNVPDMNANPQALSEDQYDPLSRFSKAEKAKRILTKEEIQRIAEEFGVSYEQAWEDAKAQGYQVPPTH
jgi:2,4-dienoyl-CoA reductase-like NADH-dependent reductase (Old Yellow Enzyme family)